MISLSHSRNSFVSSKIRGGSTLNPNFLNPSVRQASSFASKPSFLRQTSQFRAPSALQKTRFPSSMRELGMLLYQNYLKLAKSRLFLKVSNRPFRVPYILASASLVLKGSRLDYLILGHHQNRPVRWKSSIRTHAISQWHQSRDTKTLWHSRMDTLECRLSIAF